MKIFKILKQEMVFTGISAKDRHSCLSFMVEELSKSRPMDTNEVLDALEKRDLAGTTIFQNDNINIAIPHAFTNSCKQVTIAIAVSPAGIPWGSGGKKAHLIFLILGPPQIHSTYLRYLSRIGVFCETSGFVRHIVSSEKPGEILDFIEKTEQPLEELKDAIDMPVFCVAGAGNGGLAMAGHLILLGCKVNIYNRTPGHIEEIISRGGIKVEGEVEGFADTDIVTSDPGKALTNADIIMVVVPATAHRQIAETFAPYLKDGQVLVLNPGRTGGALEVHKAIKEVNPHVHVYIAEAQTLLYASRKIDPGQVRIFSIKNAVPVAFLPSYLCPDLLPIIRKALPQFVPGTNVLKTSLDNIGAVFHPAITILNASRIEETSGDFEYYIQGVTPAIAKILEVIDAERVAVAAALGIRAQTAREWLYSAYDAAGKTIHDAIKANPGYRGIMAPPTVSHRYIWEEVPASLVPIASMGKAFGVPTPVINALIDLASAMHGVNYWSSGRTMEKLGLDGMNVKEIRFLILGMEV